MFAKRLLLLFTAATLMVTGCKKDDEPVKPEDKSSSTLTANAGADQSTALGQTVTLDGSASKDSEGKPFDYQWAFTKKPATSTVNLANAASMKPTFVPDQIGEYEIELTISNKAGNSKDKVMITVAAAQPLALKDDIKVKTVLEDRIASPDLPDYVVNENISVNSELTIKPGVVIAFARDISFSVNSNGGLIIAKGEPNKKIKFTGVEKTKGYWKGVMVYSASNANEFENVEILYAGSQNMLSGIKAGLTTFGGSKAQLAFKNSLIAFSGGFGMHLPDGTVLREFSKNTFSDNAEAGIHLDADNVAKLDAASVFTSNNGRNVVEIMNSSVTGNTVDEIVWPGFADKTPYRLLGSLTIDAALKLNPGVIIEVARDGMITINGDSYLNAKGTATNKIVFTGVQRNQPFWRGIMSYSTSSNNIIENAEVSHAGSVTIISGKKAAIALYGNNAILSVKNTKISGCGGHGIFVSYGCQVNADAETANTFESNALEAVLRQK